MRLSPQILSTPAGSLYTIAIRPPGGGNRRRGIRPLPWVHAMRQQAVNFVRVCRGEIPPPCAAAEAVEDLKAAREYIRLRGER